MASLGLSDLLNAEREIPVKVEFAKGVLEFTVTYDPTVRSAKFEKEMLEAALLESEVLVDFLAMYLKSWTLKMRGEDAEPLPLNRETLASMPTLVIEAINNAIKADRSPKK